MKRNLKSEKGAITLVVLIGMLFLTAFLMSMYIAIANKAQNSAETTKQIEERYNNLNEANAIYDSYFANTDIIPIYTKEQLAKIGSGEQILINGKIYTFSANGYYTLQNDLNLGGVYNESTGNWSGPQWTPLTSDFTGTLDGLGNTISGIYLGQHEGTQGIFQELNGTIKNLYIKNSYKITNMNGLLAGKNNGEIINCYYEKAMIGLKTGDYVNYIPTTGTYAVAGGEYGSGTSTNQTFTTETGENALKWRVLSIDETTGEIELISATAAQESTPLNLYGADGYNHAVDILNDLCKKLYSKENVAEARSIKVEDINEKTTYDYTTYYNSDYGFSYGETNQLSASFGIWQMNYPKLYIQEKGYGTAGIFNQEGLDVSEGKSDGITDSSGVTTYSTITGSINGASEGTDPYITYTFYEYLVEDYLNTNLGVNSSQTGLLNIGTLYWIASRCIYIDSYAPIFDIHLFSADGYVGGFGLYVTDTYCNGATFAVRPVVSLSTDVRFTKDTVNSTDEITYWNIKF